MIRIALTYNGIVYINLEQVSEMIFSTPLMQIYSPDISKSGSTRQYKIELVECDPECKIYMNSGESYKVSDAEGKRILALMEDKQQ